MRRFILMSVFSLLIVAGVSSVSEAGSRFGYSHRYGYAPGHNHFGRSYNYQPWGYGGGYGHGYGGGFGGYGGGYYHDTSHYDYHPTTVYRHGNHLHVQPGHFDFHRTGHWDH